MCTLANAVADKAAHQVIMQCNWRVKPGFLSAKNYAFYFRLIAL